MLLKYGSKFVVKNDVLREISEFRHTLCTSEEIKFLSETKKIVTVGDVTTSELESAGITPFLSVVDLKTKRERKKSFRHKKNSIIIRNEASTLSHDLFIAIKKSLNGNEVTRIEVIGEEDLAVIPIIYYADFNTVVAYGIPDRGIACIHVEQNIKSKTEELIKRMSVVDG